MTLSVIIPTYNRISLLKHTLDSLDTSHHKGIHFEVIVVDDNSTDGTGDFIKQNYPHVLLLKNKRKGAAAARNTGLDAASGKYILFLDSDDLVGKNYFSKKIELLEQRPDMDACYGEYEYFLSNDAFREKDVIFKHKYPLLFSELKIREHLINYLNGNYSPLNSFIWRKDFLQRINGFDESLTINQDVNLFVTAIFNNIKIKAVEDGTRVYIREHLLDNRVGDAGNAGGKWEKILLLRKKFYTEVKAHGYDDEDCCEALSSFLFNRWKLLRRDNPSLAGEYLKFAKQVHWPVKIKGNIGYRILSVFFGPVGAVNIKHFLLQRD
jgi:glycosyltransferase involved in cell wall biosynthesis